MVSAPARGSGALRSSGVPTAAARLPGSVVAERPRRDRRDIARTALLAALPVLSLIAVVVGWDAAVRLEIFSDRLLPAPATVVHAAAEMYSDGTLFAGAAASFRRALQGFVVVGAHS